MDFKTFYRQLTPDQRQAFAQKVHTTVGYCHQIACGTKRIELGLGDAIVAVAPQFGAAVTLDELPLTDRAQAQRQVRGHAANEPWDGVTAAPPEPTSPRTRWKTNTRCCCLAPEWRAPSAR